MKASEERIENPLGDFIEELHFAVNTRTGKLDTITQWVMGIQLVGRSFTFDGYEYQKDILLDNHPDQTLKKGSQVGITEVEILRHIYNLLKKVYPVGVMVVMPTGDSVTRYSKTRFNPLIEENRKVKELVTSTDSVEIKKVSKAFLHLVGGRSTHKVDDQRRSSIAAKSTPVDALLYDEFDELDKDMVEMFEKRMGNSDVITEIGNRTIVGHRTKLSTPTVTGYGIESEYEETDQMVWTIRCEHCGHYTCLELEFPACLIEYADGRVIRACMRCKKQIHPRNGIWVAQNPSIKEKRGRWISRLNHRRADLPMILHNYQNKKDLQELFNSELARGYVPKESELTMAEVFERCGEEPMLRKHPGPCAMGIDVMKTLYVAVGFNPDDKRKEVCFLARVSSFNDVADIAKRFNVQFGIIDKEPEMRKAKEFSDSQTFPVFLIDYTEKSIPTPEWDYGEKVIKINRTVCMDKTYGMITDKIVTLPRRDEEVEVMAKQMASPVKYLRTHKETNTSTYHYRSRGEDHYHHVMGYLNLALDNIGVYRPLTPEQELIKLLQANQKADESPLMMGLKDTSPITNGIIK